MPYLRAVLCICVMAGLSRAGTAQNVQNEEVDVSSVYTPELADAVKVQVSPGQPGPSQKPEPLDYNLPLSFYQIPYQPLMIRPIRLPDEKEEKLENAYAKIGFGTQLTPLAELYINSGRSKKLNYGLYGKYISSHGLMENQDYSDGRAGGSMNIFVKDKLQIPVNAWFSSNTLYYYGYDHQDTTFDKLDIRQRFNRYGMQIGLHNLKQNVMKIDYGVQAGFQGVQDINHYGEINPWLNVYAETPLHNGDIAGASLSYAYYSYHGPASDVNDLTAIKPYYRMQRDRWSFHAALEIKVDQQGFSYFLPDAVFTYDLIDNKLVFLAGWQAHLQVNDFYDITEENPFVADTLKFRNTRVDEKYIGFRVAGNSNFAVTVKGYQKAAKPLIFFLNDSLDLKRFIPVYEDAVMYGGQLELSWSHEDDFRITGTLNAFHFSEIDDLDRPYHYPVLDWTLSGMYRFNSKLQMLFDIYGVGKSWALLPANTEEHIPGTLDLNISATYTYSRYFNIFVNLNNLAGFKYQRYYPYPTYGLQALAGISFTF